MDVSELCREINTTASIKRDDDMSPAVVEEDGNSDERIVDLERRVGKYYEYVFSFNKLLVILCVFVLTNMYYISY